MHLAGRSAKYVLSGSNVRILSMTNTFWIAANVIFDLGTGHTSQVLMLVNRESDATFFDTEAEARTYLEFVHRRAKHIEWHLEGPTPQRPSYVIRGEQQRTGG